MFLQATLHRWQPIHLSRWKVIESWALISILPFHLLISHSSYEDMRVPYDRYGSPCVEAVRELAVASGHKGGFQPLPRERVVEASPYLISLFSLGNVDRPLLRVVCERHP